MYIYESHLGGIYVVKEKLDYNFLYCEQCGDSDWYIGKANTLEEFENQIRAYYKDWIDDTEWIEEQANSCKKYFEY